MKDEDFMSKDFCTNKNSKKKNGKKKVLPVVLSTTMIASMFLMAGAPTVNAHSMDQNKLNKGAIVSEAAREYPGSPEKGKYISNIAHTYNNGLLDEVPTEETDGTEPVEEEGTDEAVEEDAEPVAEEGTDEAVEEDAEPVTDSHMSDETYNEVMYWIVEEYKNILNDYYVLIDYYKGYLDQYFNGADSELPATEDAAPAEDAVDEELPIVEEEAPIVDSEQPVTEDAAPAEDAVDEELPIVEEEAPIVDSEQPVTEDAAPAEDAVDEELPIVEEERTTEIQPIADEEPHVISIMDRFVEYYNKIVDSYQVLIAKIK